MSSQNRIALVTGGAQGIGLASARALLEAGNRVAIIDLLPINMDIFPKTQHASILSQMADVTDTPAVADFCARIEEEWGPLGILVNNAGISPKQPNGQSAKIMDITAAEWTRVFEVNLGGILRLCQIVVPQMQKIGWGRIINMASLAGRTSSRVAGASYSASKAALVGLTRSMAGEMGPLGITTNTVAPGRILTAMALQAGEEVNNNYAAITPVRRLGTPEDVAAVVTFLASEAAGFINGAAIDVNGGVFTP